MLVSPESVQDGAHLPGEILWTQELDGFAEGLLAGVAEHPLGGRVPARDGAVERDGFTAEGGGQFDAGESGRRGLRLATGDDRLAQAAPRPVRVGVHRAHPRGLGRRIEQTCASSGGVVAAEQGGVVIYLRQEGRGIGLINKLKAYNLQDKGFDTASANTHLGFEVDARQYDLAVEILHDLGIRQIRLLTNNTLKIEALENAGIEIISREPLIIEPKAENAAYLRTKRELMGHLLK